MFKPRAQDNWVVSIFSNLMKCEQKVFLKPYLNYLMIIVADYSIVVTNYLFKINGINNKYELCNNYLYIIYFGK